ncbi:MAG: O-antigen ligase family protein [Patescibacteria group bacterium]
MNFAGKTARFLAYFFAFFLPWQTRLILFPGSLNNGVWEYGTVSLYATEIVLWLAIICAIITRVHECKVQSVKCKVAVKGLKFWGAMAAVGVIVFSIVRSGSPELGWYWVLHAIEAVGIFWLVRQNFVRLKPMIIALLCGAVLQLALAFWQFSAQEVFASKWLGMAAQDSSVSGVSVVENDQGRFLRAYGSLPHPNILGGYLAIAIVIAIASCKRLDGVTKSWVRFVFPATLCFLVSGLVLSFSRSAWIALFLGSIIWLFLIWKKPTNKDRRNSLRIFYILHATFYILILILWPLSSTRIFGEGRLERFSIEERSGKLSEVVKIIGRHPLFGVGPGNYTLAVYRELDNTRPGATYQPVHNVFLLALAELGILGFVALGFLEALLTKGWRFLKKSEAFAVMAILLALMLFDHFLWSLPFGLWLSGFALGFASLMGDDIIEPIV